MPAKGGGILKCRVHNLTKGEAYGHQGLFAGVPQRLLTDQLLITHDVGELMMIRKGQVPAFTCMANKPNGGTETMAFFCWEPYSIHKDCLGTI